VMSTPTTMDLSAQVEAFAAARATRLTEKDEELRAVVTAALADRLAGVEEWARELAIAAAVLWLETYEAEGGQPEPGNVDVFVERLTARLELTANVPISQRQAQIERVTTWVSVFTLNDATVAAVTSRGDEDLRLRWVTMRDEDVRAIHRPLEGQTITPGGTFDVNGHALHFPGEPVGPPEVWISCVLGQTQVTWAGQDVLAATRRQYVGTFVELRTRDGHHLTITPNHPVLTPEGYVPAGDLRPGGHVLATREPVAPDVADGPPSIEQVYGAASENGEHRRVDVSGVDFHGDRPDDEVDVVWPHRDLTGSVGDEAVEGLLVDPDGREPVGVGTRLAGSPLGSDGEVLETTRSDVDVLAGSLVRGGGQGPALGGGEARHAQPHGLAAAAEGQSEEGKPVLYDWPSDAETARHLQDAYALGMQASELVEVNFNPVVTATHVFNLHTSDNNYTANGITVHNCRCMAMPVSGGEMSTLTAATTPGGVAEPVVDPEPVEAVQDEDVPPEWDDEMDIEVPWHGILAVEGIPTGDLRRFASQALTYDEFPQSLTWQRASAQRHDGAVVVGRITNAWTDPDGLVRGEGMFRISPEADEVIDMIANGDIRGVSVELDSLAMEYSDADGNPIDLETARDDGDVYQHLTAGRVRSATVLPVAAFAESYIALGPWPEESESVTASCAPCVAAEMDDYAADLAAFAISEASWDGSAARFDDEQWTRACVVDRGESHATAKERYAVPVREPNGDLNRAGVHAAAGRIDQVDAPPDAIASGKRKIIAAYKELGEDPPEGLTASAFGITSNPSTHDGPGWITNPEDTQRLRTYWTTGPGAAKIRWGEPMDFNRCRRQLAKYVPNPSYLAGTCANLHYVALGVWPGRHLASQTASASLVVSEAGVLAASGEAPEPEVAATSPAPNLADPADLPRAEWFRDPGLPMPSPITIVQDKDTGRYRLVGHAAQWGVCHIGLGLSVGDGGCTTAPHSVTNYAYYRTGAVETDQGLVPTGAITMATGHAGSTLGPAPAAAHYDNTGTVIADVSAGEDEHGIWVAGLLRPNVSAEQRAELLAATLSGDWRWIGGNLEMVATLAVNTPGFPIPRLAVAASGGRQTALFAAGIVPPRTTVGEVDGAAVLVSAAEVARELHRLAKADAAREQALADLDGTRRSVNSERAAKALSVIASGK
jgi:hypothetical protein